jgi:hypothetical protein
MKVKFVLVCAIACSSQRASPQPSPPAIVEAPPRSVAPVQANPEPEAQDPRDENYRAVKRAVVRCLVKYAPLLGEPRKFRAHVALDPHGTPASVVEVSSIDDQGAAHELDAEPILACIRERTIPLAAEVGQKAYRVAIDALHIDYVPD